MIELNQDFHFYHHKFSEYNKARFYVGKFNKTARTAVRAAWQAARVERFG